MKGFFFFDIEILVLIVGCIEMQKIFKEASSFSENICNYIMEQLF